MATTNGEMTVRIHHVVACCVLVAAMTFAGVNRGVAASATAPVPMPTRPTEEVCDAWSVLQGLCDAQVTVTDDRYTCYAGSDVGATFIPDSDVPRWGYWAISAYGFHGCPDKNGDLVRVLGAIQVEFNGIALLPASCGDLSSCTSDASNIAYTIDHATAIAWSTTTTYTDVTATATDLEYYLWL